MSHSSSDSSFETTTTTRNPRLICLGTTNKMIFANEQWDFFFWFFAVIFFDFFHDSMYEWMNKISEWPDVVFFLFFCFVFISIRLSIIQFMCVCVYVLTLLTFQPMNVFNEFRQWKKKQSKKKKDPSLISLISGFIFFRFRCCCCHTWHKLSWIIGWMNGHRANFSLYLKDKDLLGNETFFFSFLLFFFLP